LTLKSDSGISASVRQQSLQQFVERSRQLDPADCIEGDVCQILKIDT